MSVIKPMLPGDIIDKYIILQYIDTIRFCVKRRTIRTLCARLLGVVYKFLFSLRFWVPSKPGGAKAHPKTLSIPLFLCK
jgi:hypothetical protein